MIGSRMDCSRLVEERETPAQRVSSQFGRASQSKGAATRAMSGSGMIPPTCCKGAGARCKPNSSTAEPELDSAPADHDHVNKRSLLLAGALLCRLASEAPSHSAPDRQRQPIARSA